MLDPFCGHGTTIRAGCYSSKLWHDKDYPRIQILAVEGLLNGTRHTGELQFRRILELKFGGAMAVHAQSVDRASDWNLII